MKRLIHDHTGARICHIMYLLCVFLCLLVIIYAGIIEPEEESYVVVEESYESLPVTDCTQIKAASTPMGFSEYCWELSSPAEKSTFFILYTAQHYADVYIDGKQVLDTDKNKSERIYHGSGGKWVYIPINLQEEKTQLRVVVKPIYRNAINRQVEFFLGDPISLFRNVRAADTVNISISVVGIFFGLGLLSFWFGALFLRKRNLNYMRYLGVLLLLLSICRLSGMRSSSIILPFSSIVFGYIFNFSLIMAWMTFDRFIDSRYDDYSNKWFYVLRICNLAIAFFVLILHLSGVLGMRSMMLVVHIGILVDLAVVGVVAYCQMKRNPKRHTRVDFAWGMTLTLGVIVDLACLYVQGAPRSIFFTFFVFLFYVVYIFVGYLCNLQKSVYLDVLTRLLNRRGWEQKAAQIDMDKTDYGLILFDMDNLKITNDSIGHHAGDRLLIEFSRLLKRVMPEEWDIFRIGGDEFLVVVPENDCVKIPSIIEKLELYVGANNRNVKKIHMSYSLGIAVSKDYPDKDLTGVLAVADNMMYLNKQAKKKINGRVIQSGD